MGLRGKGILPLAKQRILVKVKATYDPADDMELRHALLLSLPRSLCLPTSPSTFFGPLPEIRSVCLLPSFVPSAANASWSSPASANISPNPHLQSERCDLGQRLQLTSFKIPEIS